MKFGDEIRGKVRGSMQSICRLSRAALITASVMALAAVSNTAFSEEPFRVLTPAGQTPHPAVLLVSGCSGFVPLNGVNVYDERAAELQAAGYLVVFVDYLGRRHLRNCAMQMSTTQVGVDILEAAAWTRARTDVDPNRISVIGWSYGGGGVIAALMAMPRGGTAFAKAVMYYPVCRGMRPWSITGVSVLMHLGAKDEVAPANVCDRVVNGVPANALKVMTYPNARHGFDVRSLPEKTQYEFGSIGYDPEAARAAWATTLSFLK